MMDLTPQADTLAAAASKAELLAVGVRIAYLGMLAVFFGLIAGQNFGPPRLRPAK